MLRWHLRKFLLRVADGADFQDSAQHTAARVPLLLGPVPARLRLRLGDFWPVGMFNIYCVWFMGPEKYFKIFPLQVSCGGQSKSF